MILVKILIIAIITIITVLVFYLGYKVHNDLAKFYPPIDYLKNSQENIDIWRWRQPHIKLRIPYDGNSHLGIKNAPGVSSFIFPEKFRLSSFTAYLVGVFLIVVDFLIFLDFFKTEIITVADFLNRLLVYFLLLTLGLFFLQVSFPVLQIDLYLDRIGIVTKYAFCLRRTTIYKRSHLLNVKGKVQSFWTMEKMQIYPDYKITIVRPILGNFHVSKTFSLVCNQTTGSWVVGALNYWKSVSL